MSDGAKYSADGLLGETIISIAHPVYGHALWTARFLRKEAICIRCLKPLRKKLKAYGPITNGNNRAHRLCVECVFSLPPPSAITSA